jgi:LPXTG-motif cell wall-anchored protein
MKTKLVKPSVLMPIIIGIVLGEAGFILGSSEDAPGVVAMGLALAFGLCMLGIRNAGVIKKGLLAPILLFCYAIAGIILDFVLLFDHEFEDKPWLVFIGLALSAIMIAVGVLLLYRRKKQRLENLK